MEGDQPTSEHETDQRARAAKIISDLMDMLKDHSDYHGSGPIDEAWQFLRDIEIEEENERNQRSIEDEVKDKFAHLSDRELMKRMNRAPDFGYDDEEVELTRRLKLGGLAWRWSADWSHPVVEIFKPEGEQ